MAQNPFKDDEQEENSSTKKNTQKQGHKQINKGNVKKKKKKKKDTPTSKAPIIVVGAVVGALVIGGLVVAFSSSTPASASTVSASSVTSTTQSSTTQSSGAESTTAGLPDFKDGSNMTLKGTPTSEATFMKDLEGSRVDTNFSVASISTEVGFVNYTKHYTVTGDGTVFMWLNATYRGRKYFIQVPFNIYRELPNSGITVCDMEVDDLEGGGEVITYMNVVPNYKQLLEKGVESESTVKTSNN